MPTTRLTGTLIKSGSIPVTALGGGVVTSSAQVASLIPTGTVSSSAQVKPLLPDGTISSSAQINVVLDLDNVVSSSAQVNITQTTGYSTFSSSLATIDAGQTTRIDNLASLTSSYAINSTIQSQLAGVVSSSAQVKPLLPGGTVTSSAQYPGWVTASSQIDYNSITNKLSGVVSSSTQIAPLLPNGTVSSSAQYPGWVTSSGQISITGTSGYSTFSSSIATKNDAQDISINALNAATSSYAINATIQSQLAGVASSSAQVKAYLPGGTVSSSGQVDVTATTGYSTFSSSLATVDATQQVSLNALNAATSSYAVNSTIQSQLAGVVSSSAQVKPLLPGGTVTSSAQYPGWVTASSQVALNSITGTTFATADFTFPQNLTVAGNLTAQQFYTEFVSASVIYESGSTKFGNTTDDIMSVTGSIAVLGGTISGSMVGMFSSSAQVDYNSIQNKLSGVVSASAQVKPLLPGGTVTSSAASSPSQGTVRISINGVDTDVDTGLQTADSPTLTGLTVTGLTANQAVFTNGTDVLVSNAITGTGNVVMSASPTLTGTLTAANITATGTMLLAGIVSQSSQIDYNSITNKLSGVYSSSAFTSPSQGTVRLTLNGSALTDVDTGLQSTDGPTFAGMVSTAIISGSGVSYRMVVPVGTNYYAT